MFTDLVMIDETTLRFDREIWIAADATFDGDGSKSRPYRAPNGLLDPLVSRFGRSAAITLMAGQYSTSGFRVPWRHMLSGLGKDSTFIKVINNARSNFGWPHVKMFADDNWANLSIIKDLTLDGNVQGQDEFHTNGNFKVDLIVIKATKAKVENVRIRNFGANGKSYEQGLECFPLSLSTYASGPPLQYFPMFNQLRTDASDWTYLEIKDCEVEGGYFLHGGYCTSIFVQTAFGPAAGDRQPFGLRTTPAALVHGNIVRGIRGGIAYGAASSEMVTFRDNLAVDCKAAFNFDTGEVQKVRLFRNQFLNMNQGIRIRPNPNSRDVAIDRNVITLTEPYLNPVTKQNEPWYWLDADPAVVKERDNYVHVVGPRRVVPFGFQPGPGTVVNFV